MLKDYLFALSVVIFVFTIMLVPIIIMSANEQQWLTEHNCKLIHQNPDYSTFEYDVSLKMMMHKNHQGKKFYECENGEWH